MKRKIVALLLVSCMAVSITACSEKDVVSETSDIQQVETSQQENVEENETEIQVETEENTEESAIELIAGEQGEYGKMITMSEGTDLEESFYVYYVPSGTYEVTNKGEYMTQVSVYEEFAKNEETGYDEYTSTGKVVLLDVGKTDTIEIPEGWFIEIHEPTHISLTLTN